MAGQLLLSNRLKTFNLLLNLFTHHHSIDFLLGCQFRIILLKWDFDLLSGEKILFGKFPLLQQIVLQRKFGVASPESDRRTNARRLLLTFKLLLRPITVRGAGPLPRARKPERARRLTDIGQLSSLISVVVAKVASLTGVQSLGADGQIGFSAWVTSRSWAFWEYDDSIIVRYDDPVTIGTTGRFRGRYLNHGYLLFAHFLY